MEFVASPRSEPSDHHLTIGFLSANIHIGAGQTLWPGVVDAARARGLNLICFPGGSLRTSEGFESQRNVIYNLATAESLDGVVSWSSTLGPTMEAAEVTRYHRRFQPLPIVSLAQLMEGIPTILVDSYQGMRAAILHLIEGHGYQRLASLLELFDAREILHVTFGSVLTERAADGKLRFYEHFMNLLRANADAYAANLKAHFARHLQPFCPPG